MAVKPTPLALGLLVVVASLAGCLQDTERRPLETGWTPEATVWSGPTATLVGGWPSMVAVEGPVSLPAGVEVGLTDVQARVHAGNDTVRLSPTHIGLDGVAHGAEALGDDLVLSDGTQLQLSFLPAPGQLRLLPAGEAVNLSLEVQWRYRQGDQFDAGRLEVEENVTVEQAPGLGVGAAETQDGRLTQVVFTDVSGQASLGTARVQPYAVRTDGKQQLAPFEVVLERGTGVVIAVPAGEAGVPEGDGYIVYVLESGPATGSAVLRIGEVQEATPAPGLLALGVLALTATALARRRRG